MNRKTVCCFSLLFAAACGDGITSGIVGRFTEPFSAKAPHALSQTEQLQSESSCHIVMEADVLQLQEALSSGLTTSHHLVECYLARIDAFDQSGPALNAISAINPRALEDADALDSERCTHGSRGPLHGIPVILKDNYDTTVLPATAGSILLNGWIPGDDAFQWQRLHAAGAILLATANMFEWARGPENVGSRFGDTRNPYDPNRYPGGSSGGPAAAIAANFAAVGMGSDTTGSLRMPAWHNNLVSLRPSYGLSSRSGIIPVSHTQDTAGPIGRTVTDIAVVLDATVGFDPNDLSTREGIGHVPKSYVDYLQANGLEGARIGALIDLFGSDPLDAEVEDVVRHAIQETRSLGATIIELPSPDLVDLLSAIGVVVTDEFRDDLNTYLGQHPTAPVSSMQEILDSGMYHPWVEGALRSAQSANDPEGYARRLAGRRLVRDELLRLMNDYDVDAVAYPILRRRAAVVGMHQTGVANVAVSPISGLPAIVFQAGFTDDEIPVGIELLSRAFSEPILIKLAYSFEQGTHHRRPPASTPELDDGPD